LERETHQRMSEQDAQVARSTIEPLVRELESSYSEQTAVQEHLKHVQEDLIAHAEEIRRLAQRSAEPGQEAQPLPHAVMQIQHQREDGIFARYSASLLVDNRDAHAAPVVVESNPTYYN